MNEPLIIVGHDGEAVSPELAPLLLAVYAELGRKPVNLPNFTQALRQLLVFLSGPGRTNANCWAADLFFGIQDGWDRDWEHLPDAIADLLSDMGGALHDTVAAPAIAEDVESTPEQLLARLNTIQV